MTQRWNVILSRSQVFSHANASEDSRVESTCSLNEFYVTVTIDEPRRFSKEEQEEEGERGGGEEKGRRRRKGKKKEKGRVGAPCWSLLCL